MKQALYLAWKYLAKPDYVGPCKSMCDVRRRWNGMSRVCQPFRADGASSDMTFGAQDVSMQFCYIPGAGELVEAVYVLRNHV